MTNAAHFKGAVQIGPTQISPDTAVPGLLIGLTKDALSAVAQLQAQLKTLRPLMPSKQPKPKAVETSPSPVLYKVSISIPQIAVALAAPKVLMESNFATVSPASLIHSPVALLNDIEFARLIVTTVFASSDHSPQSTSYLLSITSIHLSNLEVRHQFIVCWFTNLTWLPGGLAIC